MKINIFTYLTGYGSKIYERFVGSLFDTGFDSSIYLFVHNRDLTTLSQLDQSLLEKISIVNCPDHMNNQTDLKNGLPNKNTEEIHPQNFRYLLYLGFLQQNKQPKNEYSFFCDSRDVLFQKNPNLYNIQDDIDMLLFEEDTIIRDCFFNREWFNSVKKHIPDGKFDYINKKAINSGTILVKNTSLSNFIGKFCETMMTNGLNKIPIIDQGIHNYLYYNDLYKCNCVAINNDNEFINTVGSPESFKGLNNQGQIINQNNQTTYIVHQYDRMDKKNLKEISNKYDFTL